MAFGDYIKRDYDAMADTVAGVSDSSLETLLGTGWMGHMGTNDPIPEADQFADLQNPACFSRRELEYSGDPKQMCDGDTVIREGVVRLLFFLQSGARDEVPVLYQARMMTAFWDANDDAGVAFEAAVPQPAQYTEDGNWALYVLEIPFTFTT